ncbi:MAG: DUF2318 domain-containing protein [Clostridiales bacterium]|nr:DUF2318 domain-containing protein [Clostridiales bacterium]
MKVEVSIMCKKTTRFFTGVIAAVMVIVMVGCSSEVEPGETQENTSDTADAGIEIRVEDISTSASYYDTTVEGTTVEIFAVLASDGTVRLAMNTCQVCNGSPYAYFEQDGDDFVCQNCGNHFSSDEVGLTSGGCNPVPITEDDYTEENGIIRVSDSFLEENAYRFSNWKQF